MRPLNDATVLGVLADGRSVGPAHENVAAVEKFAAASGGLGLLLWLRILANYLRLHRGEIERDFEAS